MAVARFRFRERQREQCRSTMCPAFPDILNRCDSNAEDAESGMSTHASTSETIDNDHARRAKDTHRFQHPGNAVEIHPLMHNFSGLQETRLAHRQHLAKTLSLHPEGTEELELVEQDHIDWQTNVTSLPPSSVANLNMTSELPQ